jgi:hypothetical protein
MAVPMGILGMHVATTQNPIPQINDQTSPANERIWVLCFFPQCMLQCYPSIQLYAELAHISAGIDFWTYVDWDFSAHSSESYTLSSLQPFFFQHLYILSERSDLGSIELSS